MSMSGAAEDRHEIIIVRRGHDDDDEGHHGGVWKIAFADFMTAMMCFFLVMWLINAANEQTKAAVASYFNPVQLVDRNSSRKGLQDLGDGPSAVGLTAEQPKPGKQKAGQDGNGNDGTTQEPSDRAKSPEQAKKSDERLFADPYAVLSEIAANTGTMQNVSSKGAGGAQNAGPATGAEGGPSYRDPFSPDFWSQQQTVPGAEASAARAKIEGDPAKPGDKVAESENPPVKALPPAPALEKAPLEPLVKTEADKAVQKQAAAPAESQTAPGTDSTARKAIEAPAAEAPKGPSAEALKTAAEVNKEIARAFNLGDKMLNGISVEATDKGVAISITDQLDFGMFEIGSATPSRDLVLAMDKIGRIVNAQKGSISIEGHTDARPFHSASYDNWRLSTARAHAAYYMLVRGGVDESRIKEVAGFADRDPKDKADPYAAVNRRIEILLETGG
ncbi:MAG: MotB family protein [Mesorhizobium sp.]|nr:MotB family protein [Mesorhizobium sp.]MBN9242887.1 MotB family protein [Mesorhizobium sp.]